MFVNINRINKIVRHHSRISFLGHNWNCASLICYDAWLYCLS